METSPENDRTSKVRDLASKLNFNCELFYHEESGKTTEQAEQALGIDKQHIIKCLLLKSKKNEYIGAIVRGSDKVDFKVLESLSGYKGLRMAKPEDIENVLGFAVGGVPAMIFSEKSIRTYVDENVLSLDYVVGSGGTPFHGMKFNPSQLKTKLNYIPAEITKESS